MDRSRTTRRSLPLPILVAVFFALGLGSAVTAGLSVGIGSSSVARGVVQVD